MNRRLTTGVICATLTPLDGYGEPCVHLLVEHCKLLLDAGCSAIVLLGTTGEANSFTVEERKVILAAVVRGGIPVARLIVGTGCCSLGDCRRIPLMIGGEYSSRLVAHQFMIARVMVRQ